MNTLLVLLPASQRKIKISGWKLRNLNAFCLIQYPPSGTVT